MKHTEVCRFDLTSPAPVVLSTKGIDRRKMTQKVNWQTFDYLNTG